MMLENSQLQLAFDFVQFTNRSVFLTGKAGTGKTTFLHQLKKISPKRMAVVAPTGVAAINAGGVTIHSFFQMSFGPQISDSILSLNGNTSTLLRPAPVAKKFNKEKIKLIQSLDLLVIDEISMVRSDMLDAIDEVLRKYKNRSKPFGGVQLLMIGDLHQLSPVIKDDEWTILRDYYDTVYFFGSRALQKSGFVTIELTHIFRQNDKYFIDILEKVRTKSLDDAVMQELNKRYIPNFNPRDDEGYIILTTHNSNATEKNYKKLNEINKPSFYFEASVDGNFPPYAFPTEVNLELKVGAQVMFVKNDSSREKLYYNGKIGTITLIEDDIIYVKCPGDHTEIPVNRDEWQNVSYSLDNKTKEVVENVIGTFIQYPLKLAWAITIHKSQGLTFDRAIIDAQAAFAYGQVYVALSRCRTLEGLVLSSPVTTTGIRTDEIITEFSRKAKEEEPSEEELIASKVLFQQTLLLELFDFVRIQKTIAYFKKICIENSNIIDTATLSEIQQFEMEANEKIFSVSHKFKAQLNQLFLSNDAPETSNSIQERVKKAASYFSEIIEQNINIFLENFIVDTDNKAVKAEITDAFEKIRLLFYIKKSCFKYLKNGFKTLELIRVQANAEIDFGLEKKPKKVAVEKVQKNIQHPELYAAIKQWRKDIMDETGAAAFMILHQKHIVDLVNRLPMNIDELAMVKGFGKKRVAQYGSQIIAIVSEYRNSIGMETELPSEIPLIKPEKKVKVSSKKISLEMFLSGKTISEIAHERSVTPSTIEGHLAQFISTGELDVTALLAADKIDAIQNFFIDHNTSSLGDAKSYFGELFSFSELRFVLNSLRKSAQANDI